MIRDEMKTATTNGPLIDALNALDKQIATLAGEQEEVLMQSLSRLQQKVRPICTPPAPMAEDAGGGKNYAEASAPQPARSELYDLVRRFTDRLSEITERQRRIANGVETLAADIEL